LFGCHRKRMARELLTKPFATKKRQLAALRQMAVRSALFDAVPLAQAMSRLQFVQYDPIRVPACAQDLILRHRVTKYRAGDLARCYDELGLDEGYLHVYGAMTQELRRLVQPWATRSRSNKEYEPKGLAREVLQAVKASGTAEPKGLRETFGAVRSTNDWGGQSLATTRALEELHYHGLLRVVRRVSGKRVYEYCAPDVAPLSPNRNEGLLMFLVRTLAPISLASLAATYNQLRRATGIVGDRKSLLAKLLANGDLELGVLDNVQYVWPAQLRAEGEREDPDRVRFLSPFDPLVWDRARFTHLMGWTYRFEAYIPPASRKFGYYAMPVLFGDRAIGWVNFSTTRGPLTHEINFASCQLAGKRFIRELEREVVDLKRTLTPRE